MKIQVILGSTRPGRVGERVAKWVAAEAEKHSNFEVELVDLADFDLPHFNETGSPRFTPNRQSTPAVKRWTTKVGEADGYLIVTPEYNRSFPGILKDALDYLDHQISKKPVAVVSYGVIGGVLAAEHLKMLLVALSAAVVPEAVSVARPQGLIDEEGTYIGDTSNPYGPDKMLITVLKQLAWWTETLKAGREAKALV